MKLENRHISVWGDSILKGIIFDESASGYRVLENNCVSRFARTTGTNITNHASYGMTTVKACERIQRSIGRNPPGADDIILVEFGGNDCDFNWKEVSENPDAHHDPRTPVPLFAEKMQAIIDAFKSFSLSPILMSLPPLEPNRYLDWISRGLSRENILKWLGDVNKIYRWQELYNDTVLHIARSNSLRLVDVRRNFLLSDRCTSLLCADGIHPNEQGHAVICNSFVDYARAV